MKTLAIWGVVALAALYATGCGSSAPPAVQTPEERFARAKALFDKEDYLDAISEFTVITLQNQGSAFAPDAQYYLGECRYQRGEYLLAAYEYSLLKRSYPASSRVADGQYKLALCYYNLSPKPPLDQQYTRKAIDEFQSFAEYYPAHPLARDADQKIKELDARLAKKQYETAVLYGRMNYYKASILSYDVVIERYHDTEYAPLAFLGKAEVLISRDRYAEAATEISKFFDRYPNSVLRGRAEELKRAVDRGLAKQKQSDSTSGSNSSAGGQQSEAKGGS
jgi:outer membrane protein assembly factor BamD